MRQNIVQFSESDVQKVHFWDEGGATVHSEILKNNLQFWEAAASTLRGYKGQRTVTRRRRQ